MAFVEFRDVCKVYRMGEVEVAAVDGMSFDIEQGELAVVVLCYGDILLPMLGVSLPMDSQVGAMVFYVVSILAQAGLYILAKNRLAVTYAGFYDLVTGQNAPQKIIEIQE